MHISVYAQMVNADHTVQEGCDATPLPLVRAHDIYAAQAYTLGPTPCSLAPQ